MLSNVLIQSSNVLIQFRKVLIVSMGIEFRTEKLKKPKNMLIVAEIVSF